MAFAQTQDGRVQATTPYLAFCAGVGRHNVPGTDHRLAAELATHLPVLWVDPTESVLAPAESRQGGVTGQWKVMLEQPNLARLTVTGPPMVTRVGVRSVAAALARRAVRAAVGMLGAAPEAVLLTTPRGGFREFGGGYRVYYATDDYVAGARLMGMSARYLARRERRVVAEADHLLGVTDRLVDRWSGSGKPTTVLPNGCDPSAFAGVDATEVPADVVLRPPVAGVVGQLSARLDLSLVAAVADSGVSVLLVGPLVPPEPEAFDALVALPNVQWVGRKEFSELPGYLRVIDVGLTPYADDEFNRASFPLKTLEYLSAGRAVVSTPLPAVAWLDTDLIRTAGTPSRFAAAVRAELSRPRSPAMREARRQFAASHSWSVRAESLLQLISEGRRIRSGAR